MMAVGVTGFEQAVARAYSSKVGLGGGSFHVGGAEGPADSVYLGVFRREVLTDLGGFDEHYHRDRKSTRLNSSHANISYAVFCLKKKTIINRSYYPKFYS